VSSRLHLSRSRGKPVDFGDPQLEHGYNANAVCPGFVPATAAASTSGAMHWLIAHVLPHMPFATSIDAADTFVFMALGPSLDRAGGKFFATSTRSSQAPSHTTSAKQNASGNWQASSPA
jgi:retinol dehydrogenase-12